MRHMYTVEDILAETKLHARVTLKIPTYITAPSLRLVGLLVKHADGLTDHRTAHLFIQFL